MCIYVCIFCFIRTKWMFDQRWLSWIGGWCVEGYKYSSSRLLIGPILSVLSSDWLLEAPLLALGVVSVQPRLMGLISDDCGLIGNHWPCDQQCWPLIGH